MGVRYLGLWVIGDELKIRCQDIFIDYFNELSAYL